MLAKKKGVETSSPHRNPDSEVRVKIGVMVRR